MEAPSTAELPWMFLAAAAVFGYLLGSIPFGLVITKLSGLGDIRAIGSGNIGTTNVLRTGRKDLAAATLLCDALKGTAAVLIAGMWGMECAMVAGLAAFLGHVFPVWLRFKGGKGVATYLGVLIALAWPIALLFAVIWLGVAFATRYSSLAALLAATLVPVALLMTDRMDLALLFLVLSAMLMALHHQNIRRLLAGTESRIGKKSSAPPPAS
ncbi:glycerol-3-phosphate acyltransferase [Agaricicola taiwanensis]|uniref:Glycerol-3-phosphate acyltransferase n=1 Tax=Agaricicola taiwanensis TaxID=591372 RepID=A0A8J3DV73_9RHOB|nr:glycerol-3-phosphate 1-O-acyltransferase PlsY [Agaricicola taiwanensis]GGE47200.1 glycerol-3-phosphate acyltransferase [Agaricicola taiwanensis]